MWVIAQGVDLVHCPRIERTLADHGQAFLDRVYTPGEQRYCLDARDPVPRLSGRFAVKEAVFKLLGTGWRGGIEWIDVETLPDPMGRPLVALTGRSAALAGALGVRTVSASISHAGEYAIAWVLGLGAPSDPAAFGA